VKVVVYTCTEYSDCLPGFAYLFNTFWSSLQPVAYAGCAPMPLPPNFEWYNVESRVAARWSDGLIEFLQMLDDDILCWLLEDYYLCRTVQHEAVRSLSDYMLLHPEVVRMDLTADRLHSGHAVDVDVWGHCDIIETGWDVAYQFSTQAALWNRHHLLNILRPEMSPWDFELQDVQSNMRVLGTRQWPVRYVNLLGMGLPKGEYRTEHRRTGLGGETVERIPQEHVDFMQEHGLFPPERRLNNE
jgi:hypothetical protein